MVSKASDDLPEPDRPVKTISLSRGSSMAMFLRLCSRAPRTTRESDTATRLAGPAPRTNACSSQRRRSAGRSRPHDRVPRRAHQLGSADGRGRVRIVVEHRERVQAGGVDHATPPARGRRPTRRSATGAPSRPAPPSRMRNPLRATITSSGRSTSIVEELVDVVRPLVQPGDASHGDEHAEQDQPDSQDPVAALHDVRGPEHHAEACRRSAHTGRPTAGRPRR